MPLEPDELRREVASSLRRVRERHEGAIAARGDRGASRWRSRSSVPPALWRPNASGCSRRLLAYLLAACGESTEATIPASELVERFTIPAEALEEHLALLNLVNFGGGCYAVYAELRGDTVHVDKELFGDTFRSPPRLTPLEARAIRLVLEFVGPMIAAEAHRPLEKLRRKLEETFGQFDLAQTASPRSDRAEEHLIATLSNGIKQRRLVELEYVKVGEDTAITHVVEPYWLERQLPHWYVHTWDRTRDGVRSFRLDRMRSATRRRIASSPARGSSLITSAARAWRASSTARTSPAGRWSVARSRSAMERRSPSRRSAARSGSSARSSASAAKPQCWSLPIYAGESLDDRVSCSPSSGSLASASRSEPVKAIRIHEDGGPEVLRYEDAPDPEPGPDDVLVELRAASLNHLDVWVRKGLPSVPKPRILGADGAGLVAACGANVQGFEPRTAGRYQSGHRARRPHLRRRGAS